MKNTKGGFSYKSLSVVVINLGCDKNRVDAEKMLFKFTQMGLKISDSVKKADLIIVNTCAFIKSAIDESEKTIKETLTVKKSGAKVLITGCYAERFYDKAKQDFPEVDGIIRLQENQKLEDYINTLFNQNISIEKKPLARLLSTPKHYAFLKISDGCNNFCTYCTIPFIRGRYKSEPMEDLVNEAKALAQMGTKELIFIAQDVTRYGQDLYGEPKLVELIQKISAIDGIECIRLHYCYPEMVDDKLINEVVTNDKVAKYFDIPLQHISDRILKAMNRRGDSKTILNLLDKLHKNNITVRSTFIVGFPTETEQDFNELVDFLKNQKMKYVGFFAYSREENTKAAQMEQVPDKIKKSRLKRVQEVQYNILKNIQKEQKGKVIKAICDGFVQENVYLLRGMDSSPEVDTNIYVYSESPLEAGKFYNVKIKKVINDIDLEGVIV